MKLADCLVALTLFFFFLGQSCGESDSSSSLPEQDNSSWADELRGGIANATDAPTKEVAIDAAMKASLLNAPQPLVSALAQAELERTTTTLGAVYESLRASGFSIQLEDGTDFTPQQFAEVMNETLLAAQQSSQENLGWVLALGRHPPGSLTVGTSLSPAEAALIALLWSSAAASPQGKADLVTDLSALSFPGKGALGVISAGVGGALWWGAGVVAGGIGATVAVISAPGLLAVGAGLAIGLGAYLVGSAFLDAVSEFNSTVVGLTDSGDLVTGAAIAQVTEEIDALNSGGETCQPDCFGRSCGPDGCGDSCGECEAGTPCVDGQCTGESCIPDCDGRECGDDGCANTCGSCPVGEACLSGMCVDGTGDCCTVHAGSGCDDTAIMECVCKHSPVCCDNHWSGACVIVARDVCGAACGLGEIPPVATDCLSCSKKTDCAPGICCHAKYVVSGACAPNCNGILCSPGCQPGDVMCSWRDFGCIDCIDNECVADCL